MVLPHFSQSWLENNKPYSDQQDARDDIGGAEATGIKGFLVQTGRLKFQNYMYLLVPSAHKVCQKCTDTYPARIACL